jgi:hypothetical protein
MASLRFRNGVYFVDYRVNGVRHRVSTKTGNKKLAELKPKGIELGAGLATLAALTAGCGAIEV